MSGAIPPLSQYGRGAQLKNDYRDISVLSRILTTVRIGTWASNN